MNTFYISLAVCILLPLVITVLSLVCDPDLKDNKHTRFQKISNALKIAGLAAFPIWKLGINWVDVVCYVLHCCIWILKNGAIILMVVVAVGFIAHLGCSVLVNPKQ